MKSALASSFVLLSITAALPTEPDRTLPPSWAYTISSLRGPGCPDFADPSNTAYNTRLTYGLNTADGTEIYYWHVAYPYLRVNLEDGKEHSWCETELQYKEYKSNANTVEGNDYRLRVHKNGTRLLATYDLEDGVKATFKAIYDAGDDEITDSIVYKGTVSSGQYAQGINSPVSAKPELFKLPKCGSGKIKFRADLFVEGKKGKKGFVASEQSKDSEGKVQYYGTQVGFSYDWEKCKK